MYNYTTSVFDVREEVKAPIRGYTYIIAQMILDVNMDAGFMCKARFFMNRHTVDTSPLMTYASLV